MYSRSAVVPPTPLPGPMEIGPPGPRRSRAAALFRPAARGAGRRRRSACRRSRPCGHLCSAPLHRRGDLIVDASCRPSLLPCPSAYRCSSLLRAAGGLPARASQPERLRGRGWRRLGRLRRLGVDLGRLGRLRRRASTSAGLTARQEVWAASTGLASTAFGATGRRLRWLGRGLRSARRFGVASALRPASRAPPAFAAGGGSGARRYRRRLGRLGDRRRRRRLRLCGGRRRRGRRLASTFHRQG